MNFASVEKIAAAILYEGYILYPYRPSAIKNRQRWNFGTLYPRVYAEARNPQEPFRLVAECLVAAEKAANLNLRIHFLQLLRQTRSEDGGMLTDPSLAWDEAVERTAEWDGLQIDSLIATPRSFSVHEHDLVIELTLTAAELGEGACKLHIEVQNTTPLVQGAAARRDEALAFSFVSAHLLLGISGGAFVSLLDPAPAFRAAAADCHSLGCFPVLAGEAPDRSLMLCSPIILYDYPQVAPESEGDFFDGTEMDEMLTLRVLTLTDAEKQEMRNGDPRARKILERTEALTADAMLRAHGVIRELRTLRGTYIMTEKWSGDWNPFAEITTPPESVRIAGIELRTGDRVRICPAKQEGKQADIMDLALAGRIAVIEAIEQDFESRVQLALVLDDDPGREFGMMRQPGHRFFFSPDEVEPVFDGEPI